MLLSPEFLSNHDIRFTELVQHQNEIVITYPGAFHYGWNEGFNVAQAANFPSPMWSKLKISNEICLCGQVDEQVGPDNMKEILSLYEK